MAQSRPFLGFTLRDTLTRLVPGIVVLTPLLIGLILFSPNKLPNGPIFLALLGLSAFLIGEVIDQFRSGLFRVPMTFRYFVYRETDEIDNMSKWYQWLVQIQEKLPEKIYFYEDRDEADRLTSNLDLNFREDIESELGVDFEENRPREIYDLFLIYMEPYQTPRLRRMQSVSMFSTNLRIATAGALIIYTLYWILNWKQPFFILVWITSLLIGFFTLISWSIQTLTKYQHDEMLFKEYYMKRQKDRNN